MRRQYSPVSSSLELQGVVAGLTPNTFLSGPAASAAWGKCLASGVPLSLPDEGGKKGRVPPYEGGRGLSFNAVALATQEILAVGMNLATMVGLKENR